MGLIRVHACSGLVAVLTVGFAAAPAQPQEAALGGEDHRPGQITSVTMTADPAPVRDSSSDFSAGRYDVSLTYNVIFSGRPVELSALGLDGVSLQAISVQLDGEPVTGLEWNRVNPTGGATQAWKAVVAARPEGTRATLDVRYEVSEAFGSSGALTLPVMVVGLDPPAALPGAFVAEVRLPTIDGVATHVRQAFPTDVTGGTGLDDPVVIASLPALPRTLRFQLGMGEATPWARTSLLELLATALIVGFGLMGWRHLVRSV